MKKSIFFDLLLLGGLLLVIASCSQPAPARHFAIEELLIDLSVFPPGWHVSTPPVPVPVVDGAIVADDSIQIVFTADSPTLQVAAHEVYRFSGMQTAAVNYRDQLPRLFNNQSVASLTPWALPSELPYESPVADQSRFACHKTTIYPNTTCRFIGQYDEYLVVFHAIMGPDRLTYTDLGYVLQAVDERMAHYLAEDTE